MVLKLSTFFRSSLTLDATEDISLAEEIALQRLYLEIEKVRFPRRLKAEFDVPEELENARLPALILQPIVENVIKHAVSQTRDKVEVSGSSRGRPDRTVHDRGQQHRRPSGTVEEWRDNRNKRRHYQCMPKARPASARLPNVPMGRGATAAIACSRPCPWIDRMADEPLRVLIADDEPLAAERLQLLLAKCEGIDLVGTATDGDSRGANGRSARARPAAARHRHARARRDRRGAGAGRPPPLARRHFHHRLRPVRGGGLRGRGGRLSDEAGRACPAPAGAWPRPRLSRAARDETDRTAGPVAASSGILGVGPDRAGAHRRARHRPGVGRARLHAAPRRDAAAG